MCDILSWFTKPPEDTITKEVASAVDVFKDFEGLQNTGAEDAWFHYPYNLEDWMRWCYSCRSACPPYTSNEIDEVGFDCDDFALCFAAWVRQRGLSNACWVVWGICDGYGHAWSVVQCPEGKYEIEPQTGEAWVFGSHPSYEALLIK